MGLGREPTLVLVARDTEGETGSSIRLASSMAEGAAWRVRAGEVGPAEEASMSKTSAPGLGPSMLARYASRDLLREDHKAELYLLYREMESRRPRKEFGSCCETSKAQARAPGATIPWEARTETTFLQ